MLDGPYVRYQATTANARGIFSGVFALVNGLHFAGRLSDEQAALRREIHDWFNENLTNPADVDRRVFDRAPTPPRSRGSKPAPGHVSPSRRPI